MKKILYSLILTLSLSLVFAGTPQPGQKVTEKPKTEVTTSAPAPKTDTAKSVTKPDVAPVVVSQSTVDTSKVQSTPVDETGNTPTQVAERNKKVGLYIVIGIGIIILFGWLASQKASKPDDPTVKPDENVTDSSDSGTSDGASKK